MEADIKEYIINHSDESEWHRVCGRVNPSLIIEIIEVFDLKRVLYYALAGEDKNYHIFLLLSTRFDTGVS